MAMPAARPRPLDDMDEGELIARARRGDVAAAAELLSRHDRLVFRTCRRLLPAGEDVEAAAQETLLRALRSLPSYTGAGSFSGWLVAIAANYCRDRLRRRKLVPFQPLEAVHEDDPDPMAVIPAAGPSPERTSMARQAVALLHQELDRLPGRQREVFSLRFFVGLDLEGIATALGVDVGTVKTHLHRAVHRVRAAVEEAMP
ncbi:MAG: sigma-70 family RNA polymerase sigma factor [Thermoanaerobaculaceae bacterium]|jgi:RNA polymerase sigma-70 factor (ECF subfamily)|nr:sigma-70 family RNA polymerase sigma factor [Thermoanaerobaculaceae bacterium]